MKKYIYCVILIIVMTLSGCSNSELKELKSKISEDNLRVDSALSSYDNSMRAIKVYENIFVSNLFENFEKDVKIDFIALNEYNVDMDFELNYAICKSKILQTAKKNVQNLDMIQDIETVKVYLNENKEIYPFFNSDTGAITHVVYVKFPSGVVVELVSEWYDGVINNLNIREV